MSAIRHRAKATSIDPIHAEILRHPDGASLRTTTPLCPAPGHKRPRCAGTGSPPASQPDHSDHDAGLDAVRSAAKKIGREFSRSASQIKFTTPDVRHSRGSPSRTHDDGASDSSALGRRPQRHGLRRSTGRAPGIDHSINPALVAIDSERQGKTLFRSGRDRQASGARSAKDSHVILRLCACSRAALVRRAHYPRVV